MSVVIVTRETTPVCQKVLNTSCSELNCVLATSCKDIFLGICLHKSDSSLIIDWHWIYWFCTDNCRYMYMVHSHVILPVPPYFSFKAVFQTTLCNNIPVLPIRLFLHWHLFCTIIEFDVWRRTIFSKLWCLSFVWSSWHFYCILYEIYLTLTANIWPPVFSTKWVVLPNFLYPLAPPNVDNR